MRLMPTVPALVLLLVVAVGARAGEGKKAKKPEGTRGVVTSVDVTAGTFTFRAGKKKNPQAEEVTVYFNEKTKFVKLGDTGAVEVKAEDLAPKQRVTVVYTGKDGKNVATKVTLTQRKKKPA
jgi:hypothetical protein